MDDLVFAIWAFDCSEDAAVFVYLHSLHFFVAISAKDCVVEYIRHVYTSGVYFINVVVQKDINGVCLLGT